MYKTIKSMSHFLPKINLTAENWPCSLALECKNTSFNFRDIIDHCNHLFVYVIQRIFPEIAQSFVKRDITDKLVIIFLFTE